jgi:hypothetical protein
MSPPEKVGEILAIFTKGRRQKIGKGQKSPTQFIILSNLNFLTGFRNCQKTSSSLVPQTFSE